MLECSLGPIYTFFSDLCTTEFTTGFRLITVSMCLPVKQQTRCFSGEQKLLDRVQGGGWGPPKHSTRSHLHSWVLVLVVVRVRPSDPRGPVYLTVGLHVRLLMPALLWIHLQRAQPQRVAVGNSKDLVHLRVDLTDIYLVCGCTEKNTYPTLLCSGTKNIFFFNLKESCVNPQWVGWAVSKGLKKSRKARVRRTE